MSVSSLSGQELPPQAMLHGPAPGAHPCCSVHLLFHACTRCLCCAYTSMLVCVWQERPHEFWGVRGLRRPGPEVR